MNLSINPPKFIILTSGNPYPGLNLLIKEKYLLVSQIENANIYSRIRFGPHAQVVYNQIVTMWKNLPDKGYVYFSIIL